MRPSLFILRNKLVDGFLNLVMGEIITPVDVKQQPLLYEGSQVLKGPLPRPAAHGGDGVQVEFRAETGGQGQDLTLGRREPRHVHFKHVSNVVRDVAAPQALHVPLPQTGCPSRAGRPVGRRVADVFLAQARSDELTDVKGIPAGFFVHDTGRRRA